jgi:hypothetical protein
MFFSDGSAGHARGYYYQNFIILHYYQNFIILQTKRGKSDANYSQGKSFRSGCVVRVLQQPGMLPANAIYLYLVSRSLHRLCAWKTTVLSPWSRLDNIDRMLPALSSANSHADFCEVSSCFYVEFSRSCERVAFSCMRNNE